MAYPILSVGQLVAVRAAIRARLDALSGSEAGYGDLRSALDALDAVTCSPVELRPIDPVPPEDDDAPPPPPAEPWEPPSPEDAPKEWTWYSPREGA